MEDRPLSTDDPIDLSTLDPMRNHTRIEQNLLAIDSAIARHRLLDGGHRPAALRDSSFDWLVDSNAARMIAASMIAAASLSVFAAYRGPEVRGMSALVLQPRTVSESLGIPRPIARWVDGGAAPTAAEIVNGWGDSP